MYTIELENSDTGAKVRATARRHYDAYEQVCIEAGNKFLNSAASSLWWHEGYKACINSGRTEWKRRNVIVRVS
jgi:hypothetical protein